MDEQQHGVRGPAGRLLSVAALVVIAGAASACRPMVYDIDRIADPVAKARFSCQYLLERGLATEREKDPDGVLRKGCGLRRTSDRL